MDNDRMAWFREAKFGMFIHWGLYSLLKRGEWVMHSEALPAEKYRALAEEMDPGRDAVRQWIRLAARAGMKYVVLTAKHHDGFCLFNTQLTDFNSAARGAGRDYVREFVEACRGEGLRVGLYYSLGDWSLPAYQAAAAGDSAQASALALFIRGQIRELLTNYGRIDILWYDGAWYDGKYLTPEILGMAETNAMVRELQPDIIINDRSGLGGDFSTCENECRPAPMGRDWEMCTCINDIWGYCEHDYNYKTFNQLVFLLVNCATQGGNLLLNISPRGDGSVPEEQERRLSAVGAWLETHGESIYGVERLPGAFFPAGRIARKAETLYLHAFYWPGTVMRVPDVPKRMVNWAPGRTVLSGEILTTGMSVRCGWDGSTLVLDGLPASPPDKADTVICVSPAGV